MIDNMRPAVRVAGANAGRCYNGSARDFAYMFTRLTGEVAEWLKAAVC